MKEFRSRGDVWVGAGERVGWWRWKHCFLVDNDHDGKDNCGWQLEGRTPIWKGGVFGVPILGDGPRERSRLKSRAPNPGRVNTQQSLLFPIISFCLSSWALLGVTGVVQRPFYHVCSDSIVSGRGCRRATVWLLMESTCFQCARARLAPARARSVSSRSFSHSFSLFPLLFPPFIHVTLAFSSPSSSLAPLGPRHKHTATQGATPSARSLRGRHNRRRKLPFPCALRSILWHRVSSPPATQGHL